MWYFGVSVLTLYLGADGSCKTMRFREKETYLRAWRRFLELKIWDYNCFWQTTLIKPQMSGHCWSLKSHQPKTKPKKCRTGYYNQYLVIASIFERAGEWGVVYAKKRSLPAECSGGGGGPLVYYNCLQSGFARVILASGTVFFWGYQVQIPEWELRVFGSLFFLVSVDNPFKKSHRGT